MSRSKWKGVFIDKDVLSKFLINKEVDIKLKLEEDKLKQNKVVNNDMNVILEKDKVRLFNYKGNLRNSTIVSAFVGYEFLVFNGRKYNSVVINPNMVGFKFGDFSLVNVVGKYKGHKGKVVRDYHRAVRKVTEKRERRARRAQKLMDKDD